MSHKISNNVLSIVRFSIRSVWWLRLLLRGPSHGTRPRQRSNGPTPWTAPPSLPSHPVSMAAAAPPWCRGSPRATAATPAWGRAWWRSSKPSATNRPPRHNDGGGTIRATCQQTLAELCLWLRWSDRLILPSSHHQRRAGRRVSWR